MEVSSTRTINQINATYLGGIVICILYQYHLSLTSLLYSMINHIHTGMRIQETWIPDTVPLLRSNKSKVVKSKSQDNLKDVIL